MTILFMPNGEMEMLTSNNDLIDLVSNNIGFEAGLLVKELVKNADTEEKKMNSDFRSYEMQVEGAHTSFVELSSLIENATKELSKSRMSKEKMKKIIKKMEDLVNRNI